MFIHYLWHPWLTHKAAMFYKVLVLPTVYTLRPELHVRAQV